MSEPGSMQDSGVLITNAYRDALGPAARELGDATRRALRVALVPVRAVLWSAEELESWLVRRISERLGGIPPGRIAPPESSIAAPALLALSYTTQDRLREMYATLLATAMDEETAAAAHLPAIAAHLD